MTDDELFGWHHGLNGHEFSKLLYLVIDSEAWPAAVHGVPIGHDLTTDLH